MSVPRGEFIKMFNLFVIKNDMPPLEGNIDLPIYKPHLIVCSRYYPNICITLWLDGLDTRSNKRLDHLNNILHNIIIDKGIKRFIEFKHIDYRLRDKSFIFEWPTSDDVFIAIGRIDVGLVFHNNDYVREIIYTYMDVVVNKNPKYFTNKYKLK